jgi:hypothetical protein
MGRRGRKSRHAHGLRFDERIALLRRELARLEARLEANEEWRALRNLDRYPEGVGSDAAMARTRLEKALESNPVYLAHVKLAEVIALLSGVAPADLEEMGEGAHAPWVVKPQEPVFLAPGGARGWYRSLTESIAELVSPAAESRLLKATQGGTLSQDVGTSAGDAGGGDAPNTVPSPRVGSEEAEVWIVRRDPRRQGQDGQAAAQAPAPQGPTPSHPRRGDGQQGCGASGQAAAALREPVEEASVVIVRARETRGSPRAPGRG